MMQHLEFEISKPENPIVFFYVILFLGKLYEKQPSQAPPRAPRPQIWQELLKSRNLNAPVVRCRGVLNYEDFFKSISYNSIRFDKALGMGYRDRLLGLSLSCKPSWSLALPLRVQRTRIFRYV